MSQDTILMCPVCQQPALRLVVLDRAGGICGSIGCRKTRMLLPAGRLGWLD